MATINAIYDGKVFVPEDPCGIAEGTKVKLTIEPVHNSRLDTPKKLTAFKLLTNEIVELNKADPLPQEFDEILSQRVQFQELGGL